MYLFRSPIDRGSVEITWSGFLEAFRRCQEPEKYSNKDRWKREEIWQGKQTEVKKQCYYAEKEKTKLGEKEK